MINLQPSNRNQFNIFILFSVCSSVKSKPESANLLHFDSFLLPSNSNRGTSSLHPLYPYDSAELVTIFVYGDDFSRHMNILLIPESVQILAGLIVLFKISAAIILFIIRRKFQLRGGDFISAFIDTMVAFTAGGNLRLRHKFEKWFFGIMLIGAFFIISLFMGDLLDCIYRIFDQKISTFEQLATMNAPIFISHRLSVHTEDINDRLRFEIVACYYLIFEN